MFAASSGSEKKNVCILCVYVLREKKREKARVANYWQLVPLGEGDMRHNILFFQLLCKFKFFQNEKLGENNNRKK